MTHLRNVWTKHDALLINPIPLHTSCTLLFRLFKFRLLGLRVTLEITSDIYLSTSIAPLCHSCTSEGSPSSVKSTVTRKTSKSRCKLLISLTIFRPSRPRLLRVVFHGALNASHIRTSLIVHEVLQERTEVKGRIALYSRTSIYLFAARQRGISSRLVMIS